MDWGITILFSDIYVVDMVDSKMDEFCGKSAIRAYTPVVDPEKFLIIRSPNDEASGALALFQFISQLSIRLPARAQLLNEQWEASIARWSKQSKIRVLASFTALIGAASSILWWNIGAESWDQMYIWSGAVLILNLLLMVIAVAAFFTFGLSR